MTKINEYVTLLSLLCAFCDIEIPMNNNNVILLLFFLIKKIRKRSGFFKHLTIKYCDKTFRKSILTIYSFDVWLTSLSSQKVKDKKCLNTKKDNRLWNVLKQRALCELIKKFEDLNIILNKCNIAVNFVKMLWS